MPRKRGKARRSSKRRRIKKYILKTKPKPTNIAFKERLDWMTLDLKLWLVVLDELEKRVLKLCQAQGIPAQQIKNYFAYAKKQFKTLNRFTALTLWHEIQQKVAEFVLRGLKKEKMHEINEVLEQLLQDKKIYFATQQPQLIDDYLRFKMLAYVITALPTWYTLQLRTALQFTKIVSPTAERLFFIKPKTSLEFSKYIQYYYYKTFSLHPATPLMFYTYVSTYRYSEYTLKTTYSLQFIKSVYVLTTRLIYLKPKTTMQFTSFVSVPIFNIYTLSQTAQTTMFLQLPMQQKFTLQPKIQMQFSYTITQA